MTSESLHNKRSNNGHKPGGISGIRRNRPSYSCEGCRSRRVKCDLAHPQCSSCARNGMSCLYPTPIIKPPSSSESTKAISMNKGSKRRPVRNRCSSETSIPKSHAGVRVSFWSISDRDSEDRNLSASFCANLPIRSGNGRFDAAAANSPRIPSEESHPFLNLFEQMTSPNTRDNIKFAEIVSVLPDRSACDRFYSVFMSCVHPLSPCFHGPTFDQRYQQFWVSLQHRNYSGALQGILARIPSFLSLLVAVIYHGAVIESLVKTSDIPPSQSNRSTIQPSLLFDLGIKALGLVDFPKQSDLCSLAAFILLQMDQLRIHDTSACSFVAVAIRTAQSMALHREDVNTAYEAVVAEERRRIWAMLIHLDILTARKSGIAPLLVQKPGISCIPLSEVGDQYIGFSSDDGSIRVSPAFMVARARYEASACVGAILAREAEGLCTTIADIEQLGLSVRRMEQELERKITWLRSLNMSSVLPFAAQELVAAPTHLWSECRTNPLKFVRWAEATLHYLIEQVYCDLFNLSLADVSVWHQLRELAIPHYQSLIRYYVDLNTTHRFDPFRWLCAGYHQPLKAVAVLNTDLKKQPDSPQAFVSQTLLSKLAALDQKRYDFARWDLIERRCVSDDTLDSSTSEQSRHKPLWLDRHDYAEPCLMTATSQVPQNCTAVNDQRLWDQHQPSLAAWLPPSEQPGIITNSVDHDPSHTFISTSDHPRNTSTYVNTIDMRSASWAQDHFALARSGAPWQIHMRTGFNYNDATF